MFVNIHGVMWRVLEETFEDGELMTVVAATIDNEHDHGCNMARWSVGDAGSRLWKWRLGWCACDGYPFSPGYPADEAPIYAGPRVDDVIAFNGVMSVVTDLASPWPTEFHYEVTAVAVSSVAPGPHRRFAYIQSEPSIIVHSYDGSMTKSWFSIARDDTDGSRIFKLGEMP